MNDKEKLHILKPKWINEIQYVTFLLKVLTYTSMEAYFFYQLINWCTACGPSEHDSAPGH